MVTGQFEFAHNVRAQDAARTVVGRRQPAPRSPALASSVKDLPGVESRRPQNFVGVVAEKPWQAMQAATKLKATWTPTYPQPTVLHGRWASAARARRWSSTEDVDNRLARASRS
jgi:hypothetical protein